MSAPGSVRVISGDSHEESGQPLTKGKKSSSPQKKKVSKPRGKKATLGPGEVKEVKVPKEFQEPSVDTLKRSWPGRLWHCKDDTGKIILDPVMPDIEKAIAVWQGMVSITMKYLMLASKCCVTEGYVKKAYYKKVPQSKQYPDGKVFRSERIKDSPRQRFINFDKKVHDLIYGHWPVKERPEYEQHTEKEFQMLQEWTRDIMPWFDNQSMKDLLRKLARPTDKDKDGNYEFIALPNLLAFEAKKALKEAEKAEEKDKMSEYALLMQKHEYLSRLSARCLEIMQICNTDNVFPLGRLYTLIEKFFGTTKWKNILASTVSQNLSSSLALEKNRRIAFEPCHQYRLEFLLVYNWHSEDQKKSYEEQASGCTSAHERFNLAFGLLSEEAQKLYDGLIKIEADNIEGKNDGKGMLPKMKEALTAVRGGEVVSDEQASKAYELLSKGFLRWFNGKKVVTTDKHGFPGDKHNRSDPSAANHHPVLPKEAWKLIYRNKPSRLRAIELLIPQPINAPAGKFKVRKENVEDVVKYYAQFEWETVWREAKVVFGSRMRRVKNMKVMTINDDGKYIRKRLLAGKPFDDFLKEFKRKNQARLGIKYEELGDGTILEVIDGVEKEGPQLEYSVQYDLCEVRLPRRKYWMQDLETGYASNACSVQYPYKFTADGMRIKLEYETRYATEERNGRISRKGEEKSPGCPILYEYKQPVIRFDLCVGKANTPWDEVIGITQDRFPENMMFFRTTPMFPRHQIGTFDYMPNLQIKSLFRQALSDEDKKARAVKIDKGYLKKPQKGIVAAATFPGANKDLVAVWVVFCEYDLGSEEVVRRMWSYPIFYWECGFDILPPLSKKAQEKLRQLRALRRQFKENKRKRFSGTIMDDINKRLLKGLKEDYDAKVRDIPRSIRMYEKILRRREKQVAADEVRKCKSPDYEQLPTDREELDMTLLSNPSPHALVRRRILYLEEISEEAGKGKKQTGTNKGGDRIGKSIIKGKDNLGKVIAGLVFDLAQEAGADVILLEKNPLKVPNHNKSAEDVNRQEIIHATYGGRGFYQNLQTRIRGQLEMICGASGVPIRQIYLDHFYDLSAGGDAVPIVGFRRGIDGNIYTGPLWTKAVVLDPTRPYIVNHNGEHRAASILRCFLEGKDLPKLGAEGKKDACNKALEFLKAQCK